MLHVSLARRSGVLARRGLTLTVSCQRGCKVLVTATLSARFSRRPVTLVAAARPLRPALIGSVRLRVGPSSLRRLRRALGRRTRMIATVRIVAVGPTGRRTALIRSYAVTR
jgi:hypothetical protein